MLKASIKAYMYINSLERHVTHSATSKSSVGWGSLGLAHEINCMFDFSYEYKL